MIPPLALSKTPRTILSCFHQAVARVEIMARSEFETLPARSLISLLRHLIDPEEMPIEVVKPVCDHYFGGKFRDNALHHAGGALKKTAFYGDNAR